MHQPTPRSLLVAVLLLGPLGLAAAGPARAATTEEVGGEAGILVGTASPDVDLAGEQSPPLTASVALRGASVFSKRWTWFVDAAFSEFDSKLGAGKAREAAGRTGFEYRLFPDKGFPWGPWFVSFGGGWWVIDFADDPRQDFHRPFASFGFGQSLRIGNRERLRWEARTDTTLDDAGLGGADVTQGRFLIGIVWGPRSTESLRDAAERRRQRREAARQEHAEQGVPPAPRGAPVPSGVPAPPEPAGETGPAEPLPPAPPPTRSTRGDSDGDGVRNRGDACPDTPRGALVDERGCPYDADLDEVWDGIDRCPGTPRGTSVDETGCELDSDGDGVHDGADACPETPPGVRVDDWGCPGDRDRDGVPDEFDRCPGTPPRTAVDRLGCPRAPAR